MEFYNHKRLSNKITGHFINYQRRKTKSLYYSVTISIYKHNKFYEESVEFMYTHSTLVPKEIDTYECVMNSPPSHRL